MPGVFLDANSFEPGFGRYSPSSLGIDAVINLTSEGDPLHGAPGKVDVLEAKGFTLTATEAISYQDQSSTAPSTLKITIPLSVFSSNQISLLDTGDFSAVVGNATTRRISSAPRPSPSPGPSSYSRRAYRWA